MELWVVEIVSGSRTGEKFVLGSSGHAIETIRSLLGVGIDACGWDMMTSSRIGKS